MLSSRDAQAQPVAVRSAAEVARDRAAVSAVPRSQRGRQLQRAPLDGSRPAIFQIPLRAAAHDEVRAAHAGVSRDRAGPSLPDRAPGRRTRPCRGSARPAFGGISAMSEGWALYAERSPPNGLVRRRSGRTARQLDAQLFRARRLVVDTGLHSQALDAPASDRLRHRGERGRALRRHPGPGLPT